MEYIKTFEEFVFEKETSEYKSPEYLVSPALAQDGSGVPDDKMFTFFKDAFDKSLPYFKPAIKSANTPNVDRDLTNIDN